MRLYHSGDRGEPVRDIQRRLTRLGFPVVDDGEYGAATVEAVMQFQQLRGLPSDGIVGPETWRTLVDAGFLLGDRMLYRRSPMMRGDDVSQLQKSLGSLGFDAGKVDGIFGPDTLRAVLDFQHNRSVAEDGIVGHEVVDELVLMARATDKPGREAVREHEWISAFPRSIAGDRIYVDPDTGTADVSSSTWVVATRLAADLQLAGARTMLSRSIDTSPTESQRASRANRRDVQIVVSITVPPDGTEGVYYFGTALSTSDAGRTIATHLAAGLDLEPLPRAMPILKQTRAPAVIIAVSNPTPQLAVEVARVLIDLYASGPSDD
ncbi:MAG: peptidoglycan-binding protein [Actinomycetota bacterium]